MAILKRFYTLFKEIASKGTFDSACEDSTQCDNQLGLYCPTVPIPILSKRAVKLDDYDWTGTCICKDPATEWTGNKCGNMVKS